MNLIQWILIIVIILFFISKQITTTYIFAILAGVIIGCFLTEMFLVYKLRKRLFILIMIAEYTINIIEECLGCNDKDKVNIYLQSIKTYIEESKKYL